MPAFRPKIFDKDAGSVAQTRRGLLGDEDLDEQFEIAMAQELGTNKTQEQDIAPAYLKVDQYTVLMDQAVNNYSEKAYGLLKKLVTAQNPNIMDREMFKTVAAVQRERFFGCLSLPFSFFVFLVFAVSAYMHEDITNVYFIEAGLKGQLTADMDGVSTISEAWDWIEGELFPKVFNQVDLYGEPETDKRKWNRVLMYNQLTGPLVLEQLSSLQRLCYEGNTLFGDMMCYPTMSQQKKTMDAAIPFDPVEDPTPGEYAASNVTAEERQRKWDGAFKPHENKITVGGVSKSAQIAEYSCEIDADNYDEERCKALEEGEDADARRLALIPEREDEDSSLVSAMARRLKMGRVEYFDGIAGGKGPSAWKYFTMFYPNAPLAVILAQTKYLRQRMWITTKTKQLKIKAMFMNAEVGRNRLEQMQITFRMSRAGGIFVMVRMQTLFLASFSGLGNLFVDAVFWGLLLAITVIELQALKRAILSLNLRKHLTKPWTILEGQLLFWGWVCLGLYYGQHRMRNDVKEQLELALEENAKDEPPEFTTLGEDLHNAADAMVVFSNWFRVLQSEYHLILMCRFFIAFHAQPRLGVVTSTLEASMVDAIHFMIVLAPTFLAYAISGCFMFGRRMEEFSTFDASIGVCFKMLMEGEYDWEALSDEYFVTALIWAWSFMCLLVLLMTNMVLAIVMDIYTEKRKAAGQAETVFVTLNNLWLRIKHARTWVSNRDLLVHSSRMNRLITRETIVKTFPSISKEQLDGLLQAVQYQSELEVTEDMDKSDTVKMCMAIKLSIDSATEDIAQLKDGTYAGNKKNLNSDPLLNDLDEQMRVHNFWMMRLQWQLQQLNWQWNALQTIHGSDQKFDSTEAAPMVKPEDLKVL